MELLLAKIAGIHKISSSIFAAGLPKFQRWSRENPIGADTIIKSVVKIDAFLDCIIGKMRNHASVAFRRLIHHGFFPRYVDCDSALRRFTAGLVEETIGIGVDLGERVTLEKRDASASWSVIAAPMPSPTTPASKLKHLGDLMDFSEEEEAKEKDSEKEVRKERLMVGLLVTSKFSIITD